MESRFANIIAEMDLRIENDPEYRTIEVAISDLNAWKQLVNDGMTPVKAKAELIKRWSRMRKAKANETDE